MKHTDTNLPASRRALRLSKETLQELTDTELRQLSGGARKPGTQAPAQFRDGMLVIC